jgi:hypothetical protein
MAPSLFSLIFTYDDFSDERPDDSLYVYRTESPNQFKVVFIPGDFENTRKNVGYLDRNVLQRHIHNILNSLSHDMDPFERVQVLTSMSPSVFYHVSDLENARTRDIIYDMIDDALDMDVEQVVAQ